MTETADPRRAVLAAYCRLFESLAPARLDELRSLCTADIRFVDPFQEIAGIERVTALYGHMFRTVADPRFTIVDSARSEEHTSELQSRRTISYAVFCLKKKKFF